MNPRRIRRLGALIKPAVFTRRLVSFAFEGAPIDGVTVCRRFQHAFTDPPLPRNVSTDHDPLFRFHRCLANLRVLEIDEIKSVPYTPVSHPFVETLIGTLRREFLDRVFFWNALDLGRQLGNFRDGATTPAKRAGASLRTSADLDHVVWQRHCHGLFHIPIAP